MAKTTTGVIPLPALVRWLDDHTIGQPAPSPTQYSGLSSEPISTSSKKGSYLWDLVTSRLLELRRKLHFDVYSSEDILESLLEVSDAQGFVMPYQIISLLTKLARLGGGNPNDSEINHLVRSITTAFVGDISQGVSKYHLWVFGGGLALLGGRKTGIAEESFEAQAKQKVSMHIIYIYVDFQPQIVALLDWLGL